MSGSGYSRRGGQGKAHEEAATDDLDRVTYVAGADAKTMFAQRLGLGVDEFREAMAENFFR